jgi:peroxiredoxin
MLFAQEASVEKLPEVYRSFYRIGFGVPKKITPAPDFTLKDLSGRDVTLSELEGKVVLLNLWATWCPPCRAEMPSMQELYDMFPRDEFTILAVAAPNTSRDSREKIEQHIEENEFSFPVLLDEDMEVNAAYGSGSIPTSWIVGPDGNLIARLIGARDWTEEAIVDALRELMET